MRDGSFPTSRSAARLHRTLWLGTLFAGMLGVVLLLRLYGLSFNVTDSMPIGWYHVERLQLPVSRGAIVQACLPPAIATVGRQRAYLAAGSCPGGAAPVLKIVAATGGDRVEVLERRILVNGHALPGSGTAAYDKRGRPLQRVRRGLYTLAPAELWFWTPNPSSWDSRYYGPVLERQVLGRATLLLAFGSWDFAHSKK